MVLLLSVDSTESILFIEPASDFPLLCLESTAQTLESISVLNSVKTNLHNLPDSAGLASEWSTILTPLDTVVFPNPAQSSDGDEDKIATTYHYDVDMIVIGISHRGCTWADIRHFSREVSTFKLVFQQRRRGGGNGFRAKFFEGEKSRPLWSLPQATIAKAHFGNLECDVVVIGPEDVVKSGFEAIISNLLIESANAASSDPELPIHSKSILNHLECSIGTTSRNNADYSISDQTAVEFLLNNLQGRLSSKHHLILVDLGCKSRSCTAGGVQVETLRSHSTSCTTSTATSQPDWHISFRDILASQLDLGEVESRATFILTDLGIEFSARGRFMHWDQQACKSFKTAMGGKGGLFLSFGVRQLANYDSRNTELERLASILRLIDELCKFFVFF